MLGRYSLQSLQQGLEQIPIAPCLDHLEVFSLRGSRIWTKQLWLRFTEPLLSKEASTKSTICEEFHIVPRADLAHLESWSCIDKRKLNLIGDNIDVLVYHFLKPCCVEVA